MIVVRIPTDELFNYTECEELYNKYKEELEDDDFDTVIKKSFFYSFYIWSNNEHIGCIYYYYDNEGRLFVNAFANRHHHQINLECFKKSLEWFDCDIYANGLHKTSRLCLRKCGFENVKDNLFILHRSE